MNAQILLDAIGEAKDTLVRDAAPTRRKKMPRWAKWTSAVAACLVLALTVGILLPGMGANAGSGGDTDLIYMSYDGPVLPLTVREAVTGLTATRNIQFDFSPYRTYQDSYQDAEETVYYDRYHTDSIITDRYVLTNTTDQDQTLTLLYPHAGTLQESEFEGRYPSITVNGNAVETGFHPGPYSGAFEGAWGSENPEEGSVNLANIESFEGYVQLLSDGRYMASAFDAFPVLEQKVIVYRMSDYVYTADKTAENPTLQMSFHMDYDQTYVFTYGMNGATMDRETGYRECRNGAVEYQPNAHESVREPDDAYVILMGQDIAEYTVQGYRDGGCHAGDELSDLGCTITRYETTLGQIMLDLLQDYVDETLPLVYGTSHISNAELYCALAAELLTTYGILGDEPVERYDTGRLEDLFSAVHTDLRVMYFSCPVTIPAGESITVEATVCKEASIDFIGKDKDKDGYDMATTLGSNLIFTEQTASICGFEEIEIVGQNFGFDISAGITTVTLDTAEPHYWLEVRKKR